MMTRQQKWMKPYLFLIIYSVACLLFQAHKALAQQKGRPNIIWITCEDLSPFIHVYGEQAVKTPNIDQLAKEGIRFTHMYTTAGVCAPSRSSIITGMYPISIGTQHMRTKTVNVKFASKGIPNYAAVVPAQVKAFPEYLRKIGYYTSNNEKQDYQFEVPVTVWDENGPAATYRNRKQDQPFFSIYNFFITHESQLFNRKDSLSVNPATVRVPPYYKDTPTARHDIARQLSNVQIMDQQVGELIAKLKADGVYENSYIFFYSDHGGSTPWTKREVLERGTHIPFIVRLPEGRRAGTVDERLLSSVNLAPTVLSLAGVNLPNYLQGKPFLEQNEHYQQDYVFAARDRMDELYDRVRSVRDKHFRYVRNFMPEQSSYQDLKYRKSIPMMQELLKLHEEGLLDENQDAWFKVPKAAEELYDVQNDPDELHNLVSNPAYVSKLVELRNAMDSWLNEVGDQSVVSEQQMVASWWQGKNHPPTTAEPEIKVSDGGIQLVCATPGASIGYRIVRGGDIKKKRPILTWDMRLVSGAVKEGDLLDVEPSWHVYQGETIKLAPGEKLVVEAMRIGYEPSHATMLIDRYAKGK